MAENHSTGTNDLIEEQDGRVILSKQRKGVALEAAWEIEQLCEAMRRAVVDGDEARVVRGMSKRIQDMACVVMSALDDPAHLTDELCHEVLAKMAA